MSYVGKNPKFTNMRLLDNSNNALTLAVPSSITSYTTTLPNAQGASGTTLSNDGSGNLSWVTPGNVLSYVGTNPEPGGSSPFQLVTADHRTQDINPAGDITVKLPTTSIVAGDPWTIVNRSQHVVTVQSSGGNTILVMNGNRTGVFESLVSTPTAATDWVIKGNNYPYGDSPVLMNFSVFNPTNVSGTTTNATAISTQVNPSNMGVSISAISSGTVTYTFANIGYYNVTLTGVSETGAGSYTSSTMTFTTGGTAGSNLFLRSALYIDGGTGNNNYSGSFSAPIQITAANQTLTVQMQAQVVGTGSTSVFTFYGQVMIRGM